MSQLGGLPIYNIPEPGPDKVRLAKLMTAADEGIAAVADSLLTAIAERLYAGDLELADPQRYLRNKINNKLKQANRQLAIPSDSFATAIAERVAAGDTMLASRDFIPGLPTGPPPLPGQIYKPPPQGPQPPPPLVQGPPTGPPTIQPPRVNLWKSSVGTYPPCYCLSSYSPPLHPGDSNVAQYDTFAECQEALSRYCPTMPGPPQGPQPPPAAPITTQPLPPQQQPQPIPGIPQLPPQITITPTPTIPIAPQQPQIGGIIIGTIPGATSPPSGTPNGWIIVGYRPCNSNLPPIYGTGPGIVGAIAGGMNCAIWGPPTFNPDIIHPTPQPQQPPYPIQNIPIGGPPTPQPIQNIPIGGPPTYPPTPCPPPPPCPPTPPCPQCPTRPTIADCNACGKCENGKLSGVDSKVAIIPWGIHVGADACYGSDCGRKELYEAMASNQSISPVLAALSQTNWAANIDKLLYDSNRESAPSDIEVSIQDTGEIFVPQR